MGFWWDIASKVANNLPIDLSMGYANVIWQADANDIDFAKSPDYATSPASILNIAGQEIFSVREVAKEFGKLMKKEVPFIGEENKTALLGNGSRASELLGKPKGELGTNDPCYSFLDHEWRKTFGKTRRTSK